MNEATFTYALVIGLAVGATLGWSFGFFIGFLTGVESEEDQHAVVSEAP